MYSVNVTTEKFTKRIMFFNSQTAINKAIEYASCVDVTDVVVISEETGEIGLALAHGKIECIGIIDF